MRRDRLEDPETRNIRRSASRFGPVPGRSPAAYGRRVVQHTHTPQRARLLEDRPPAPGLWRVASKRITHPSGSGFRTVRHRRSTGRSSGGSGRRQGCRRGFVLAATLTWRRRSVPAGAGQGAGAVGVRCGQPGRPQQADREAWGRACRAEVSCMADDLTMAATVKPNASVRPCRGGFRPRMIPSGGAAETAEATPVTPGAEPPRSVQGAVGGRPR